MKCWGLWAGLFLIMSLTTVPGSAADQPLIIAGQNLEIHYWPQHEDLAFEVRELVTTNLRDLSSILGMKVKQTIVINIVRSHNEMNQLVGSKLMPWTMGVSLHRAAHIIIKPLKGKQLARLVIHELTHVLLDMKLAKTQMEAPRWVHEGLAQWMEGDLSATQMNILGRASAEGKLLKFSQLEAAFDGNREKVDLAYAQSYTLVAYIVNKGPQGALGRLLEYLVDTGDGQTAIVWAMRLPIDVVEKRWLLETRTQYISRGVPITVELIITGIMLAVFLIAVAVKMRIARNIRKQMQEEEILRQLFEGYDKEDKDFQPPDV